EDPEFPLGTAAGVDGANAAAAFGDVDGGRQVDGEGSLRGRRRLRHLDRQLPPELLAVVPPDLFQQETGVVDAGIGVLGARLLERRQLARAHRARGAIHLARAAHDLSALPRDQVQLGLRVVAHGTETQVEAGHGWWDGDHRRLRVGRLYGEASERRPLRADDLLTRRRPAADLLPALEGPVDLQAFGRHD